MLEHLTPLSLQQHISLGKHSRAFSVFEPLLASLGPHPLHSFGLLSISALSEHEKGKKRAG